MRPGAMQRRPDFFVVGAPKCGTTTMDDHLGQHPEVAMCTVKEVHYFGRDIQPAIASLRDRGPLTEVDYLSLFPAPRGERRVGESSVWYLYSEDAPGEIRRFDRSAQVVIMLRDPVEMLHSLHSQMVYVGAEPEPDFGAALALDDARARGEAPPPRGFPPVTYRAAAALAGHVGRYLDAFGPERVHVVVFDDLRADPVAELEKVCAFLGVDPAFRPSARVANPNKSARSALLRGLTRTPPPLARRAVRALSSRAARAALAARLNRLNTRYEPRPPMDPELRARLARELAPEVERLAGLLDRDLSAWAAAPRSPAG